MSSDGSTDLAVGDLIQPGVRVKQEQPEATVPQDLRSLYLGAAPGGVLPGPSAAATQDQGRSACPLLPTHEPAVGPGPSQLHPDPDSEVNGTSEQFQVQPFGPLPNAPGPQGQADMTGVLHLVGNDAGQHDLPGLMRNRPRGRRRTANNPHRIAPVNPEAQTTSPTATLPQRPVQQGYGVGPSRGAYPGHPGPAYPAGPWGPQASANFVNNAGMGFVHTPQGPAYPGAWGEQAFANPMQRALVPHRGAPQRQFFAGPSNAPGYPRIPPRAAAQFPNAAANAPLTHGAGPYPPPPVGQVAAPPPPHNPAPPVQRQPRPAVVAQAGSSNAPPVAAPQVPSANHPAGRGGFECVHCRARFGQYESCSQHVINGHIIPDFVRKMGEVSAMIHAVPDPDDNAGA